MHPATMSQRMKPFWLTPARLWSFFQVLSHFSLKASSSDNSHFFKFEQIFFWLRIVSICRPEVLDGLLKRYDAEVLFFEARRHMCLMCTHVPYVYTCGTSGTLAKFGQKIRNFRIFLDFENFSKNFPKLFFVKNRHRNISFQSRARLSKIEEK